MYKQKLFILLSIIISSCNNGNEFNGNWINENEIIVSITENENHFIIKKSGDNSISIGEYNSSKNKLTVKDGSNEYDIIYNKNNNCIIYSGKEYFKTKKTITKNESKYIEPAIDTTASLPEEEYEFTLKKPIGNDFRIDGIYENYIDSFKMILSKQIKYLNPAIEFKEIKKSVEYSNIIMTRKEDFVKFFDKNYHYFHDSLYRIVKKQAELNKKKHGTKYNYTPDNWDEYFDNLDKVAKSIMEDGKYYDIEWDKFKDLIHEKKLSILSMWIKTYGVKSLDRKILDDSILYSKFRIIN